MTDKELYAIAKILKVQTDALFVNRKEVESEQADK